MRSHPVSGNSGLQMFFGRVLGWGTAAGAGLVVEEEEEEGICPAATSAASTLGSRKQKKRGMAVWMMPCSGPVLITPPRGLESACRLCRARLFLCCSGWIMLQLAVGCNTRGRKARLWAEMQFSTEKKKKKSPWGKQNHKRVREHKLPH